MKPIEAVDLSKPLAGSEGVDSNHASRLRAQVLLDQHASLIQQTQFADAKAGGIVTLVGLLALRGPVPMTSMMTGDVLHLAGAVSVAGTILFAMLAVFPRYPGQKMRKEMADSDRFSWPSLTTEKFTPNDYAAYMQTAEVSQIVHSIARSNAFVARLLLRKFLMLRIAYGFGFVVFALTFLAQAGVM